MTFLKIEDITRPLPPCAVHAERYGQEAGGMYPTGMQFCFLFFPLFIKFHVFKIRLGKKNLFCNSPIQASSLENHWPLATEPVLMNTLNSSLYYPLDKVLMPLLSSWMNLQ